MLGGGEQGLLSVAFHPRYASNRRFYVDYTDRNGDTRIVEYRSRGLSRSPVKVRQLFFQDDPYPNHNGGQLAFGPDGYLYAGTGDGGSGGDPENRAQNLRSTFGKILRFNVKKRRPAAQIVGYGLRNPWRFSFDRLNGRPLHRRRRPGLVGGAQLHAAQEPRSRELRLARVRGQDALLERGARTARAASSCRTSSCPTRRTAR